MVGNRLSYRVVNGLTHSLSAGGVTCKAYNNNREGGWREEKCEVGATFKGGAIVATCTGNYVVILSKTLPSKQPLRTFSEFCQSQ